MSEIMNRLQFDKDFAGGFANRKAHGKMPSVLPSPLLLNLGCGNDVREGFVNIDIYSNNPEVVYGDIRKLDLPDECVDMILASDVLEHFSHRETDALLKEWARVLKPDAELIIRCPSLRLQVQAYLDGVWDADIASYMIFGGQTNPGDYHCVGFDETSIRRKLHNAGFLVIEFYEENTPQDRGFINLNMTVRGKKREIETLSSQSAYSMFSIPTPEKEIIKPDFEMIEPIDDSPEFDLDLLSEISFGKANIQQISEPESNISQSDDLPELNLVWEGSQFVWHSLALINREHCSNLIDTEVANLTIIPYEPDSFSPDSNPKYRKLKQNDIRFKEEVEDEIAKLPYIWIRHQWPPKAEAPKGAKWIIMQPWEYTSHRSDFIPIFENALEIWTPSNFSRNSFINSGIPFDKVQVIPNGIDPELFTPKGEKFRLNTSKRLKFLFVGGTIYRKGFDILLDAYLSTFSAENDVTLVVKDMGGDSFYKGQTAKEFILEAQRNPNNPEILYFDKTMTEEEIASLYRACDVFVAPYRGEGFSLPTLEAMACGLPVVVTQGGSTDDFTDFETAWHIPAERQSIGSSIDGKTLTGEAFLLEPDKNELCNILRHIAASPTQVYSAGLIASSKARREWTWRRATIKLLERIEILTGKEIVKKAEKRLPIFTDSLVDLGSAELAFIRTDYEKATILFNKLINFYNLESRHIVHIYKRLIQIAFENKDLSLVETLLEKAKLVSHDSLDINYLRARLFYERGQNTESLEEMTVLFDNWTSGKFESTLGLGLDDMLVFCGNMSLDENDIESAHQYFTSALKVNTNNADACFGAGQCFEQIGDDNAANTMYEWAEKLDSKYSRR